MQHLHRLVGVSTANGLVRGPFSHIAAHVVNGPSRFALRKSATGFQNAFLALGVFRITTARLERFPVRKARSPRPLHARTTSEHRRLPTRLQSPSAAAYVTRVFGLTTSRILVLVNAVRLPGLSQLNRLFSFNLPRR